VVIVGAQQLVQLDAVVLVVGRDLERSRSPVRQRQHCVNGSLAAVHIPRVSEPACHSLSDEARLSLVVS